METTVFKQKCAAALEVMRQSSQIVAVGHRNPDGDSIGSVLAFARAFFDNEGRSVVVYSPDGVPAAFAALEGSERVQVKLEWHPDLIVAFDYGDFARLGLDEEHALGAQVVTFDHHPAGRQEGDVVIIDTVCSSTTELLYRFMREVGWEVSAEVAQCLLTGLVTDTGAFAHNTHEGTFEVAGELVQRGAVLSEIYRTALGGKDARVLNVWGELLGKAQRDEKYNAMMLFVPFSEFASYGIVLEDLAGVVSVLNRVAETDFSVFALEYEPGRTKVSFRGEEFKGVAVASIAQRLGGGGHAYAAGCTLEMPIAQAQTAVMEAISAVRSARVPV